MSMSWTVRRILTGIGLVLCSGAVLAQSGVAQRVEYGEVVSADRTVVVDRPTGVGGHTGATVGAVAGYAVAKRGNRWLGSLLGGAIGGAAGHAAEKSANKKPGWELVIRKDETGEEIGIQVPGKKQEFKPGDRVRLMTAGGQTKVAKI